jgi:GNAT superfamily N-acetyltransferase
MITIRRATPQDAEALGAIYRAASLGNAGDREALLAHPDALVWDAAAIERAVVVVALEAEQVLGFATAVPADEEWELDDLFVAPGAQRRGAGRVLVEELVRLARAAGAHCLAVIGNPHASDFYAAAGFERIGEVQTRFGTAARLKRHWAV